MRSMLRLRLPVVVALVVVMLAVVDGRQSNVDVVTSSCPAHSFYHPLQGRRIACSSVCPPAFSTDVSVRFCSLNCPEYYACLRATLPEVNGTSSQSSSSSCPQSWFYHPIYGFADCAQVCQTTHSQFCMVNCPSYHQCLIQS